MTLKNFKIFLALSKLIARLYEVSFCFPEETALHTEPWHASSQSTFGIPLLCDASMRSKSTRGDFLDSHFESRDLAKAACKRSRSLEVKGS